MDKYRQIDTFLRVARSGSFTAVSAQLGQSPAAITRLVNALEARLGVRLLNRSTRSLSLTDAGKSYAEMCERVIRDVAQCELVLSASDKQMNGLIRILVPQSFGAMRLGDAVVEFSQKYPEISVSILLGSFSARTADFVEREFDVALRWGELRESTLVATRLGKQVRMLCASPDYLKRQGIPRNPQDLNHGHNCLVLSVAFPDGIWRFVDGDQEIGIKVSGDFSSDSAIMLYKATLAGRGLAALPRYVIRDDLKSGALVEVLSGYKLTDHPLFLLYRDKRLLPARIRIFIDFLRQWFVDQSSSPNSELLLE
jgi:DNA-binding transcriptional LysR family regulator